MEQPVSMATIITLEQFPSYQVPALDDNHAEHLNRFLRHFMAQHLSDHTVLQLPSLTECAQFFQCSSLQAYDAFRLLRSQGHDYSFSGLDSPVLVWKK